MALILTWAYIALIVAAYCAFALFILVALWAEEEGWRRCKDCGIFYYSTSLYPPQHELPRTGKRIPFGICDECQQKRDEEESKALAAARIHSNSTSGGDAKAHVQRTAAVFFGKN